MEKAGQDTRTRREHAVANAARRAARRVTRRDQLVDDVVEEVVQQWRMRVAAGAPIVADAPWAYRVASNLVKRWATRGPARCLRDGVAMDDLTAEDSLEESAMLGMTPGQRRLLRASIARRKNRLTQKQLAVVRTLCEPGMSLHQAARQLRMDRSNLRRVFRRALLRLRRGSE